MINVLEQFSIYRLNINHSHISLQELQHFSALKHKHHHCGDLDKVLSIWTNN